MFWSRLLPATSFIVGTSALSFQTFVLYPWHHELCEEFKKFEAMKSEEDKLIEEYHEGHVDTMDAIADKFDLLILNEEKIRLSEL